MQAMECWKNPLNDELSKGYEKLKLDLDSSIEEKLSCPLFVHLGPHYKVKEGVFIIGQETHGWGGNLRTVGNNFASFKKCDKTNSASKGYSREYIMMESQSEWLLNEYRYHISSDFHNAVKAISGCVSGEDFLNSRFVWDDLIAVDYCGKSFRSLNKTDRKKILKYSSEKLKLEFTVAKPKFAIFFIGSYGDSEFWEMDIFKKLKKSDVKEIIPNLNSFTLKLVDPVTKLDFEICCFTTSHPNSTKWGNKKDVLKKLVEIIDGKQ